MHHLLSIFFIFNVGRASALYLSPNGFGRGINTATMSNIKAEWMKPTIQDSSTCHSPHEQYKNNNKVMVPRSGHVSFTIDNDIYSFGGYGEEVVTSSNGREIDVKRYPMNELWKRSVEENGLGDWEVVEQNGDIPEERLVSAVSVLNGKAYLFAGWNPYKRADHNEILDTIHCFDSKKKEWRKLPITFPDGPTSRHVALPLPCAYECIIHNHRCTDFIYIFDAITETFTKQKTQGQAPSSRGLHAACMLGSFACFFGGANQSGSMSNEVFLLNIITWEWTKVKMQGDEKLFFDHQSHVPCTRAAPNLVSFNETCAILYGGARTSDHGLVPLDDVWALMINRFSGEGRWELIKPTASSTNAQGEEIWLSDEALPPGRNAATLTNIMTDSSINFEEGDNLSRRYLLHGGWAPFRKTFVDDYILKVSI